MISLRDLESTIPNAPNFQYKEFVKSETAMRLNILNIPSEQDWKNIEQLAVHVLQPIRNRFGRLRITSGYRSVELCEAIKSSRTSNHTIGQAADFEPMRKGVTMMDVLTYIHNNLPYRELIAEYFPDGWIHVAYREGGNDSVLKLKDANHNYARVDLSYLKNLYGG
jgi:hypothetical protein